MTSLPECFSQYEYYHQHKMNRWLHIVGVPCVVIALMLFFGWIRLDFFSYLNMRVSWLMIMAALIYYMMIDSKAAAIMAVVYCLLNTCVGYIVGGRPTWASFSFLVVLLVGGGLMLLIGQALEKKQPVLQGRFLSMLVMPIFVVNDVASQFGWGFCKAASESTKRK